MRDHLRESSIYSRSVLGRVLFPKHQATHDTTQASKAYKCSTGESPRPLAAHIVRLVCHAGRDISISTGHSEEHAHVADSIALCESHHWQANDCEQGIENQNWCAHAVLVANPGCAVHHDSCEPVGWSDEALGFADAEAHAIHEDDGEEVGNGVSNGSQAAGIRLAEIQVRWKGNAQEDHGKAPDLSIH